MWCSKAFSQKLILLVVVYSVFWGPTDALSCVVSNVSIRKGGEKEKEMTRSVQLSFSFFYFTTFMYGPPEKLWCFFFNQNFRYFFSSFFFIAQFIVCTLLLAVTFLFTTTYTYNNECFRIFSCGHFSDLFFFLSSTFIAFWF